MSKNWIIDYNKEKGKILSGTSDHDASDSAIEPVDLVLGDYHAPEELKLRTLGAMNKMQKDREHRRNTAMRVAAAIAIMTATIAFTPLSGCVKNVAESAYDAMQNWFLNTTHQGYKKYADGCEIELVETTLVNDFLYVTLDENYGKYLERYNIPLTSIEEDSMDDTWNHNVGHEMSLRLSGELSDASGTAISFDGGCVSEVERTVGTDDGYLHSAALYERLHTYRIWIPDMNKVVTSKNGKYYCRLHLTILDNALSVNEMEFDSVKIDDASGACDTVDYPLDYSYTKGNMKFDFVKLSVGTSESNILVECTPMRELAEDIGRGFGDVYDDIFHTSITVYKVTPELTNERLRYTIGYEDVYHDGFRRKIVIDSKDAAKNPIVFNGRGLLERDGNYYMILRYKVGNRRQSYRYHDLVSTKKEEENTFRILDLYYHYENFYRVLDENGDPVPLYSDDSLNRWEVRHSHWEEESIDMDNKNGEYYKDYWTNPSSIISDVSEQRVAVDFSRPDGNQVVSHTFNVGTFSIDMEISWDQILIKNIYDRDQLIYSDVTGYQNSPFEFSGMTFEIEMQHSVYECDHWFGGVSFNGEEYHMDIDLIYENWDLRDADCTIVLKGVEYQLTDSEERKYVLHVDQDFYNEQGVSRAYLTSIDAAEEFCRHNTFTIGR